MATVWVAEEPGTRRRVAVKILDTAIVETAQTVERFIAEGAAMARIRSPFVPAIYERGRLRDGTPYTVMELVEGVDLDVYLRKHGRLSLRSTVRLVGQVAAALTEAHGIGIVHRDVKAENILVTGSGDELRAMLVDFGIAKIPVDDPGRQGTQTATMGTPAYMSPEQLSSTKDVDARADLWSLAVAAYLALTGKMPFDGETFLAVCLSIHEGIFDLPSELLPDVPAAVDAWLARAFHRNPAQRFQTARAMSEALSAIVRPSCRRVLELPVQPEPEAEWDPQREREPQPEAEREPDVEARPSGDPLRSSLGAVTRRAMVPVRRPWRWRNGALIAACACFLAVWGAVPPVPQTRAASPSPPDASLPPAVALDAGAADATVPGDSSGVPPASD